MSSQGLGRGGLGWTITGREKKTRRENIHCSFPPPIPLPREKNFTINPQKGVLQQEPVRAFPFYRELTAGATDDKITHRPQAQQQQVATYSARKGRYQIKWRLARHKAQGRAAEFNRGSEVGPRRCEGRGHFLAEPAGKANTKTRSSDRSGNAKVSPHNLQAATPRLSRAQYRPPSYLLASQAMTFQQDSYKSLRASDHFLTATFSNSTHISHVFASSSHHMGRRCHTKLTPRKVQHSTLTERGLTPGRSYQSRRGGGQ